MAKFGVVCAVCGKELRREEAIMAELTAEDGRRVIIFLCKQCAENLFLPYDVTGEDITIEEL